MRTEVQLRTSAGADRPRTELLHGAASEVVAGRLGPIALIPPGHVVAYVLRNGRSRRVFVFRTLDVDDVLAATVPGVRPRVRLLLALRTAGRARLVGRLFGYLVRAGRDPSALPDSFYVRVGAALGGRLPGHRILLSLLPHPGATPDPTFVHYRPILGPGRPQ